MKRNGRFAIGLVGVAAVVSYLVWTGVSETMVYYLTPVELMIVTEVFMLYGFSASISSSRRLPNTLPRMRTKSAIRNTDSNAIMKWPSSWTKMIRLKITMTTRIRMEITPTQNPNSKKP